MAGAKAVVCSDHAAARSYVSISLSLMPMDRWTSEYEPSLRRSMLLAKSANSFGDLEMAQASLREILANARCIQDKLPAFFLLVTTLIARGEFSESYSTCHDVLTLLGEQIPDSLEPKHVASVIAATSRAVSCIISDADLLKMKEINSERANAIKFYNLMATVSYFIKPEMFAFLVCRSVQLTMREGICNDSILGFVHYSATLVSGNKLVKGIRDASRIGKSAMSCWKKRFHAMHTHSLPHLYDVYHGWVAFYTEPLQSCADAQRQGFDVGISVGETGTAFMNAIQHVGYSFWAGVKLHTILEKIDYYLELALLYNIEIAQEYLSMFRGTISALIDGSQPARKNKLNGATGEGMQHSNHSVATNVHRAIQAYWSGHNQRCHHYLEKVPKGSPARGRISGIGSVFVHGLNSFQVMKTQNTAKVRAISREAISTMKVAASQEIEVGRQSWNFRNKVRLLEAELQSFEKRNDEAEESYAAAITTARCSRFVHEQGLACELAGQHHKKNGDIMRASGFFEQAKQCYADWGSQPKVESINEQMESLQEMEV